MTSRFARILSEDRRPAPHRACVDVNVTPLIDILLVLLIIFMSALPVTQQGLDVNIPEVEQRLGDAPPSSIMLEYTADRRISVNTVPLSRDQLEPRLREIFAPRHDRTLFVRGAGSLRYGDIVEVIDAARGAGVTRVGVVTDGMIAAAAQ
jgi:biopolymer transport protein ExbD